MKTSLTSTHPPPPPSADIYLYIVLSWHQYVGVDIASFPAVSTFYETVKALPEIVAAHARIATSPATTI